MNKESLIDMVYLAKAGEVNYIKHCPRNLR